MLFYFGKLILTSLMLWLGYVIFLEKETIHKFKRIYLLSAILLSIALPLLHIGLDFTTGLSENITSVTNLEINNTFNGFTWLDASKENLINQPPKPTQENSFFNKKNSLSILYCLIVCILLIRFFKSLNYFHVLKKKGELVPFGKRTICYQKEVNSPFSFLNTIYLPASSNKPNAVPEQIIIHESVHVDQGHSLDIIWIEIIKCFFWFNPVWKLYKNSIQLNHEFLADNAVLTVTDNSDHYKYLLLNHKINSVHTRLTSSFNFISMKKRILMLEKSSSTKTIIAKFGAAMIVIFVSALLFGKNETKAQNQIITNNERDTTLIDKNVNGVSDEAFNKYQKITSEAIEKRMGKDNMVLTRIDFNKIRPFYRELDSIYYHMSAEQKAKANIIRAFSMQPPIKKSISKVQFESFKNSKVYGVWIDGKKVPNSVLNKYNAESFANYFISKLYGAAREGRNYTHQLDLETHAYFDKEVENYWKLHYRPATR